MFRLPEKNLRLRRLFAVAVVCVFGGMSASCGQATGLTPAESAAIVGLDTADPAKAKLGDADGVVIVSATRANQPSPVFSGSQMNLLAAANRARLPVIVISPAGATSVTPIDAPKFVPENANDIAKQQAEADRLFDLVMAAAAPATESGADALRAIDAAVEQARANGSRRPLIMVVDSGLADSGALNFALKPDLLDAAPAAITAALTRSNGLPRLAGAKVIWSGLGAAALPQAPLSMVQRQNLAEVYESILVASGASSVEVSPIDSGGVVPPAEVPPVKVTTPSPVKPISIELPKPVAAAPNQCVEATTVLADAGAFTFAANSALLNPASAAAQLQPVVAFLNASPRNTARLIGTTANFGPMPGQIATGLQRAHAVKVVITSIAASTLTQVTTQGVGSKFDGYVNDLDSNGQLIEAAAAKNRTVRVTLRSNC